MAPELVNAVERLLDERERQGLPRHVEDSSALDAIAHLMADATNAGTGSRRSPQLGALPPMCPNRSAGAPLDGVLDALSSRGCNPRRSGDGYFAKCPAHDDRVASLTVSTGTDGRVLIKCHAGDGCAFADIAAALDLPETAFFPRRPRRGTA